MKDLILFQKYKKNQEASYNFKLDFDLSNRPHFNSVYLVRVPFLTGIAVFKSMQPFIINTQKFAFLDASRNLGCFFCYQNVSSRDFSYGVVASRKTAESGSFIIHTKIKLKKMMEFSPSSLEFSKDKFDTFF